MPSPRSRRWRPRRARRRGSPRSARRCRPALKAGESLTGLDELLGGSDGALAQLRQAARRIERGAADHPLLAEALAALDRALIEAGEAEDRIARAADALAFDPARLEQAEARLFDIRALARKHRVEPDALAALGRADARAARGDRGRRRAHRRARRELAAAREAYAAAAGALSTQRHRSGGAARRGGRGRACAAEARRRALPHRHRRGRAGPVGHRPRRVRSLDQPRRAVRAADPDRLAAASCRASSSR